MSSRGIYEACFTVCACNNCKFHGRLCAPCSVCNGDEMRKPESYEGYYKNVKDCKVYSTSERV